MDNEEFSMRAKEILFLFDNLIRERYGNETIGNITVITHEKQDFYSIEVTNKNKEDTVTDNGYLKVRSL